MLTPDYIQKAPDLVINQFRDLEDELIKSVAKRIKKMEGVSSSTAYEMMMLSEFSSRDNEGIDELITEELEKLSFKFKDVLMNAQGESLNNLSRYNNYRPKSAFADNVVEAIARQTDGEFEKLSKTVGFIADNKFVESSDYLRGILNNGIFQISSGAFTYDSVALRYIRELGDKGVRVFDFDSGVTREMETHLRRIMTDGVRQLSNEYSKKAAEDLGTDLMEISAHSGARPSHADWQGQIVSLSGKRGYLSLGDIGDGEVDGFGGANCRHSMYPYFEGSARNYTDEYLEELQSKTVEYDGKVYTDYEATQKQRALERGLRASQRRIRGFEAVGDIKGLQAEKIRFKRKLDGYKEFSKGVDKKTRLDNLIRYKGKPLESKSNKVLGSGKEPIKIDWSKANKFRDSDSVNNYFFNDDSYKRWVKEINGRELEGLKEYTSYHYGNINEYNRKIKGWGKDGEYAKIIDEAERFIKNAPEITQEEGESFFAYKRRKQKSIPREYEVAVDLKKSAIERTKGIEKAIEKFELNHDIITYRGVDRQALPRFSDLKDLVGMEYSDDSFMSTTPDVRSAFGGGYVMEIYVPKGMGRGAYLEEITTQIGEFEFLLQAKSKFIITEAQKRGNKTFIKMEMITR